jgi:hypothetical protein
LIDPTRCVPQSIWAMVAIYIGLATFWGVGTSLGETGYFTRALWLSGGVVTLAVAAVAWTQRRGRRLQIVVGAIVLCLTLAFYVWCALNGDPRLMG